MVINMDYTQREAEESLIGDKPFFSIFLQVKSGYERELIEKLKNKISKIKIGDTILNSEHIKILKCFGHFDIAILFNLGILDLKVESFEKISQEISQINHITDSNSVLGFSWNYGKNIGFRNLNFCWGISSIKLDTKDQINPIKKEKQVIRKIIDISNETNIKIKVFGGLGWNEIIIVINSGSLKNISDFVYKIRVFDEILDISTIPAVDWDCWNITKLEIIPNCQLLITHRSIRSFPIKKLLISLAEKLKVNIENSDDQKNIGLIFGGYDIRLPIVNSELNNIILFILKIREIKTITKTNTILSPMQIPSTEQNLERDLEQYFKKSEAIPIAQTETKIPIESTDSKLIDFLENEIRYLHFEYLELKIDDYTTSLYFDLEPFFNDLDNNVKKYDQITPMRRQIILLEQLKKIIQSLEFSIYQRISGMQMSYLMEPKHIGFEKFGGIQRIILAIETIPMEMIDRYSKDKWIGFCVFGSEPDFICQTIGEVISIPLEYKYIPERWWGLGHEISHLLIKRIKNVVLTSFNKEIRENFEKDIENFKDNIKKINEYDEKLFNEYIEREFELINETIEELCADYLNFRIVFLSDWKTFLSCTLNYLDSRGYNILSEDRLFRVMSISEHFHKKNAGKDMELFTTIKNIRNFTADEEFYFKDRLKLLKNAYYPYLETVRQILKEIDIKLEDTTLNKEILKEIDSKLNRGEVIENKVDLFSTYIIRALINKKASKNITFKYQITAILSLYNSRFSK